MPKEYPILFKAPLVREILAGRKTVTRRPVKPQPDGVNGATWLADVGGTFVPCRDELSRGALDQIGPAVRSPFGVPGDRLWVRETWAYSDLRYSPLAPVLYRADGDAQPVLDDKWRPSIHMPRDASRILLDVVSVRVERLQAIDCADIRAEGLSCPEHDFPGGFCVSECPSLRQAFAGTWDGIYGAGTWAASPWVWRVEFRRSEVA